MLVGHRVVVHSINSIRSALLRLSRPAFLANNVATSQNSMVKQFKSVTHVIFDNDGLLLNTETFYEEAMNMMLKRYGKSTFTWEMKLRQMGRPQRQAYQQLIDDAQLPITVDQMMVETDAFLRRIFPTSSFLAGAERLVAHLHDAGVPLALCTGSKRDYFELKISHHRAVYDKFRLVVCTPDEPKIKQGKPSPDCYLFTAAKLAVDPADCLVFEDSLNGVKSAISAGMQVVMVPDGRMAQEHRQQATLTIDSLLDFKPELFGLPAFK